MSSVNRQVSVRQLKVKKCNTKCRLIVFATLAICLVAVAVFADRLCPYDPYAQDLSLSYQAPSAAHIMGTDAYGRDMFSRVIVGARASILSTLALVCIITLVGTAVGTISGFIGGKVDAIVMRVSDFFLAFPGLVFALAVAALLGGGVLNAIIALAVISWPKYARVARSQTLSVKVSSFVQAAVLAGDNPPQIIFRHILPNIFGPILVTAMLDIGTMTMELAGLSFLGLGAQPPIAEWGSMMSSGRSMLQTYPWVVLSPGIAIFISVVIFNLLGDTVRDYLDPK
ncbi:peptide/nickel transport system permease protein [Pseudobutyrivibrio sp. NOR37]|uniref:ABC transporter permease n=1 Tax=Pseudobutyrivibrio xylanivorans TaxID=185007 RepID=A0A6M0LDW2_PSEXY|nr:MULTISPECIES: nickel transporter permease [Pseudobutyrivibrio]NEX00280.1 ABC transporter permease [Pseudobutyrivibrio xylanivorans]SFR83770.1 peptide/nickel transport system permease protein [Pseudobutyrivibrio sp. NOR37]